MPSAVDPETIFGTCSEFPQETWPRSLFLLENRETVGGNWFPMEGATTLFYENPGIVTTSAGSDWPLSRSSDVTASAAVETVRPSLLVQVISLIAAKQAVHRLIRQIDEEFPPPPDGRYSNIEDIYD